MSLADLSIDNAYAALGSAFSAPVMPSPLRMPVLAAVNAELAAHLGLAPADLASEEFLAVMSGAQPWPGSTPHAQVYAGHQFGVWVPRLGDGRALLLGEVLNAQGERWQLHLKGGGQTPFSRMGDGRAVLRSSIREFLASEAMAGLGIPTTRALALVASQQPVIRETVETGATVLRVAPSFLRFGHFEYFARSGQHDALRILMNHAIDSHFPALREADDPALALFAEVAQRTAELIAQWQTAGFAHGVMNTDNMSLLGLTLDYGPFAFMDAFQSGLICNHSDHSGRYAFDQQPGVALWNLCRFAESLLPLTAREGLLVEVEGFEARLSACYAERMRSKLGLQHRHEDDAALLAEWLQLMEKNGADYTRSFRALGQITVSDLHSHTAVLDEFVDREAAAAWLQDWCARLQWEHSDDHARAVAMAAVNPKYVLRNHLAQIAIERAREGDFAEIQRLQTLLARPFDEQPDQEAYAALPPAWSRELEISCSS